MNRTECSVSEAARMAMSLLVIGLVFASWPLSAEPQSAPKPQITLKSDVSSSTNTTKPRVVAHYSDSGIVGTDSQEKVKVYQYRDASGVMVFTDAVPKSQQYQVLLYDCFACKPDSTINWQSIPLFKRDYRDAIAVAARKHRIDPALIRAVIHAESAFNPKAISRTGAMGLMQLMPETAKEMGVKNAFVAEQNILGGTKYLAQMLTRFDGDIALACAAYNAGPTVVSQLNAIPPYPETQAYVERVQILLKRYRKLG